MEICPVCDYPVAEHVRHKPCLPPAPARKVRGLYDLPVFGWAWNEDAKELGA